MFGGKMLPLPHMNKIETISFIFEGKDYSVAIIPDVLAGTNQNILIGSHSLNIALYHEDKGYVNDDAKQIDEQIYAYVEDEYFSLPYESFLEQVKKWLD